MATRELKPAGPDFSSPVRRGGVSAILYVSIYYNGHSVGLPQYHVALAHFWVENIISRDVFTYGGDNYYTHCQHNTI